MRYRRYSTRIAAETLARAARTVQKETPMKEEAIVSGTPKTHYTADEMVAFARTYASLGDAVSEQLADILTQDDSRFAEVNHNAVKEIRRAFRTGSYLFVDCAIAEYEKWYAEQFG